MREASLPEGREASEMHFTCSGGNSPVCRPAVGRRVFSQVWLIGVARVHGRWGVRHRSIEADGGDGG